MLENNTNTAIKRVPHIILLYWVIKIASTTLGETGADMFSMTFDLGYATTIVIFMGLFITLLAVKLLQARYEPIVYWLTFTASAIVGTALSDYIDRVLGLGYALGSLVLIVLLGLVLFCWYRAEKSIDVEKITNSVSETWYWLAFLIANTLGTAAGDYLADDLELGFAISATLISSILVAIAVIHFTTRKMGTLLFWLAFVLTRPFGATFGDWLTKPLEEGGVDLGTIGASLIFAIILVIAIMRETTLERSDRAITEFH